MNNFFVQRKYQKFESKRGFTLIEIIVSIGIFSAVMLIGIGALLSVNDANKKARAMRVVMDNINFAVEDMARKIRIGGEYLCTTDENEINLNVSKDCAGSGGDKLVFKFQKSRNQAPGKVMYYLQTDGKRQWIESQTISRTGERFVIKPMNSPIGPGEATPAFITSPEEILIEKLRFYVVGANDSRKQPRITIVVSGKVNIESEKLSTDFHIQTTVSQRRAGSS